jgi:hypothetical protein
MAGFNATVDTNREVARLVMQGENLWLFLNDSLNFSTAFCCLQAGDSTLCPKRVQGSMSLRFDTNNRAGTSDDQGFGG